MRYPLRAAALGLLTAFTVGLGPQPLEAQFIFCGFACEQNCDHFGLCNTVQCAGSSYGPGMCGCEVIVNCGFWGCINRCLTKGGPCELGCDEPPVPSTNPLDALLLPEDLRSGGKTGFIALLSARNPDAFARIQAHPGLLEILDTAQSLPEGPARALFAMRLDGVLLEDGSQAFSRGTALRFEIRKPARDMVSFSVKTEEGLPMVSGELGPDSGRIRILPAFSRRDEPEVVSWQPAR